LNHPIVKLYEIDILYPIVKSTADTSSLFLVVVNENSSYINNNFELYYTIPYLKLILLNILKITPLDGALVSNLISKYIV